MPPSRPTCEVLPYINGRIFDITLASFKELAERSNLKDSFTEAFVLPIPRNPLHLDRSHNARPEKQSVRECS